MLSSDGSNKYFIAPAPLESCCRAKENVAVLSNEIQNNEYTGVCLFCYIYFNVLYLIHSYYNILCALRNMTKDLHPSYWLCSLYLDRVPMKDTISFIPIKVAHRAHTLKNCCRLPSLHTHTAFAN